jgi:hypothetical protein
MFSDPLLWDSKLSSGASCIHWSSLRCLQLDWSPTVVNSIDWTWFGKAHTPVYIRSHSWQCMSEQKPSQRESSETELCQGTDLGKGTKKCLQHWRFPRPQVASIILIWKKFGTIKTLPRAGRRPNWAIGWEGPWLGRWPRLQSSSVEMGEPSGRTIISAALHQSGIHGIVAWRKPLHSKWHMTVGLEFDKRQLKDS